MRRTVKNVRTENRADQLMKTPADQRGSYKYIHRETETIEVIPGEDGVTAPLIKLLHSMDDHDVYENLKSRKPEREDWEQKIIDDYKADFIKKFRERHGYNPDPAYVTDTVNEAFPKNWTVSIEDLTEGQTDDDSIGDKSSVLANARSAFGVPHKKTPAEERLEELRDTWSESWQEIYDRVLIGGESIVSIARERGVNESAVRKTVRKIRAAIAVDPELQKLMR